MAKLLKISTIGYAIAFAAGGMLTAPAIAHDTSSGDEGLAAEKLSRGETAPAISELRNELAQHPEDQAVMINLGIAYAQAGKDVEARSMFEAAFADRDAVMLETAEGDTTDSRRLARRALGKLERGEFRGARVTVGQFTLRD